MQYRTLCDICAHRDWDAEEPSCAAFPNGIPTEIIDKTFDHREAFDGDQGIRFELEPGNRPESVEHILNPE